MFAGRAASVVMQCDRAIRAMDAWLTPERLRVYPTAALAFSLVSSMLIIALGTPPIDVLGRPIAVDWTAQMTGGRMALDGQWHDLYDLAAQRRIQHEMISNLPPDFLDLFISPPIAALLWAPFAALPYLVSATVWAAISLALLVVALRLLWSLAPNLRHHSFALLLVLVISSQPAVDMLASGQVTAVYLLLLTVGLRLLLQRRNVLAGVVLGFGVLKPQLFLLVPVLLLVQRRWRALAA